MSLSSLLKSFDTGLFAATCEYLRDGSLLCGTYQLLSGPENENGSQVGTRLGGLLMLSAEAAELKDPLEMSAGVLDIKPHPTDNLVAVMLADGSVNLMASGASETAGRARLMEQQRVAVTEGMCLAGAWSCKVGSLSVSDSKGGFSVVKPIEANYSVSERFEAVHGYEVWSVCWDHEKPDVVYTGGDDSLLKVTDVRAKSTVSTVRGHDAGVTSIVSDISLDNYVLSGSYDEHIRCWDKRLLKLPLSHLKLGGGVWRIKINPHRPNLLACACMQSGCRIVSISDAQEFQIVEDFMRDRQLVYGVDWLPVSRVSAHEADAQSGSVFHLAACSFYDHVLDTFSFRFENS
ncbi:putative Diphthine methyltransferase [Hypsibius exemplaris]|uniref:methylated diphthine methylhydrolase n=1 Tax=Hypsibius exemplaris TaxID=2072580 RepID=A0A9X6NEY9_HYPEX|nr:putative Diphthine methyltransferase [Hypsibius exemplaris]